MSKPAALTGIDHVQLAIPRGGEVASREFWHDLLGMTEVGRPPKLSGRGGCWFVSGSFELHLGTVTEFSPADKAHPGILVSGIDQISSQLVQAGYEVTWDHNRPGHRRFHTSDPFGNRLEFVEPESTT